MMVVQGVLEFDRKDIRLDATYIFVMDGAFIVGTEREPFLHRAVITLHGGPISKEIPVYGAKVLACRFCTLDLHGRPLLGERTHTKLAQTAAKGSRELRLAEPVDWDVGADVALTSTSADGTMDEAETVTISAVLDGGHGRRSSSPRGAPGRDDAVCRRAHGQLPRGRRLAQPQRIVQGSQSRSSTSTGALHARRASRPSSTARRASPVAPSRTSRCARRVCRIGRYSIHFHMCATARTRTHPAACPAEGASVDGALRAFCSLARARVRVCVCVCVFVYRIGAVRKSYCRAVLIHHTANR